MLQGYKIPYVVQRLPAFFQTDLQEGRSTMYTSFVSRLESSIDQNEVDDLIELPRDFEVFHRTFGFSKEEKKHIFILLVNFLGQPYIYLTKNVVRKSVFPSLVWILKVCAQAFEEGEITIEWKHLFTMMEDVFLNNDSQVNVDLDRMMYFRRFAAFLVPLKRFFSSSSIDEVFHRSQEGHRVLGVVTLKNFIKVSSHVPAQTYWPLMTKVFQLWRLRNQQQFEDSYYWLVSSVLRQHPSLPWHQYHDFLFEKFYRELIQILPIQDSLYGYQTRSTQMAFRINFPSMQRIIGSTLANLLLSPDTRKEVMAHIDRGFGMMRFLLHPNNQQGATQKVLQLYYYFLHQFVNRYSRERKQTKKDEVLSGLCEEMPESSAGEKLDEEDDESSDEETSVHCFIDDNLIDQVVELFMNDVGRMLYLKEYKDKSIQAIVHQLVALRPQKVLPQLLEMIDRAFAREDMKYNTIVGIIGAIVPVLLDRKEFPEGLSYLPPILRTLGTLITAHDSQQAYAIWRIFDIVLQFVPVYDIDDLLKEYPDLDMQAQRLTEEICSIVLEAFRRFLSLFEFLSKKKKDHIKQMRTILISISNKFYNLVAQSSKSVFTELLRITLEYMQEHLQPHVQQYFAQLLSAFSQRDPKRTLETFLPIINEKLLRASPSKARHLNCLASQPYEFQITHQPTLLYYLSLIEELVGFSHHHCAQFDKELTAIITLCLQNEEISVFNQGLRILSQLFLGLVSLHPQDVGFRDGPALDPKWTENTSKQFRKTFTVNWFNPGPADRDYLATLMNRYYYPIMNNLLEFVVKQNCGENDVSSYISANLYEIACQLNEPQCSANLSIDLDTRQELYRSLLIVGELFVVLQMRCKEPAQNATVEKFHEWVCFEELSEEVSKIGLLIQQFFPVFVKRGLGSDHRITSAFCHLITNQLSRHNNDEHNSQLVSVRKWIHQRIEIFKNPVTKRYVMSRFMKVLLASYNLNVRILGVQSHSNHQQEEVFVQMLMSLGFHESQQGLVFNHLNQVRKSSAQLDAVAMATVTRLLQGQLFSREYLATVDNALLPKLGIFQKTVIQLSKRFIEYVTYRPGFDIKYLHQFSVLSEAYETLIDKTFNLQFNAILLKTLQHMSRVVSRRSSRYLNDRKQIITGHEMRAVPSSTYEAIDAETYEFCRLSLQRSVQLFNTAPHNIRNNIVNGLILLFNQPVQHNGKFDSMLLNDETMALALQLNISQEYSYRSFGRTLLYRLMRIARKEHTTYHQEALSESDFIKPKTFEQFQETLYLRDEDLARGSLKNSSVLGAYTYYSKFKYATLDRGALMVTLEPLKQQLNDKDYCQKLLEGILNDLQANEDNSALFHQQGNDYATVFHDVGKFFNSQVNGNLKRQNVFFKNVGAPYERIKRLFKKLFLYTDFAFFHNTQQFIVEVASKHTDKDNQMLTRLYIFGLLTAVLSSWPVPQATRHSMVDFVLELISASMSSQSGDQFRQVQFFLLLVTYDADIRNVDYLFQRLIASCDQTSDLLFVRSLQSTAAAQKYIGFRGAKYNEAIWKLILPRLNTTTDPRVVQVILGLIVSQVKEMYTLTTNVDTISKLFGIQTVPDNFVKVPSTNYVVPYVDQYRVVLETVVSMLKNPEQRKLVFDSLSFITEMVKQDQINQTQLRYYGPIVQYFIEFKEEDIENETTSQQFAANTLMLSQLVYDKYSFEWCLNLLRQAARSTFYKTRLRCGKFLTVSHTFFNYKYLLYNQLHCDRVALIKEFAFLLEDDQKQVSEQAKNLITFLTFTMLPPDQELLVDYFMGCKSETISRTGLIGMINALQNLTTTWSNRALKAVLKGNPKATYIKEFAAAFQKSHKANYLSAEENNTYEREIMEKLAEYSSPYNYFA